MITCQVVYDLDREIPRLKISGQLTSGSMYLLRTAVLKAVAECPPAIVVDLRVLTDRTGSVLSTLGALERHAWRDYAVPLLWVPPAHGSLGARMGLGFWRERLRIRDTPAEALAAATESSKPLLHMRLVLPPQSESASHARIAVGEAVIEWGLIGMAAAARRIAFELVHNSVTHAGTEVVVDLMHRGRHVYLAVRDRSPRLPRLLPANPPADTTPDGDTPLSLEAPGVGLRLVDRLATAWGSRRQDGGKLVWATLRTPA